MVSLTRKPHQTGRPAEAEHSLFPSSFVIHSFFLCNFYIKSDGMGVKSKKHLIENINVNLISAVMLRSGEGVNQLI